MKTNNQQIASVFRETADFLAVQGSEPYRQRAYRRAADTIEGLHGDVGAILKDEGRSGLTRLPAIGRSLSASIEEYLQTGHCRTLDRLRGRLAPEDLFCRIPGIGETLAHRIHDTIGVETLEELEVSAHDGRLATVAGIGEARAQAVADYLRYRLDSSARRASPMRPSHRQRQRRTEPLSVAMLIEIDREYRQLVTEDALPLIEPTRFNPLRMAWMPVWHTQRDGWTLTVLPSNSAQAHRLGKIRDWVIIVAVRDGHEEQYSVVTEYQRELMGLRVVRGREAECQALYAKLKTLGDGSAHSICGSPQA